MNTSAVGAVVTAVNINKTPNGVHVYLLLYLTTQRYLASNGRVIQANQSIG